MRHRRRQSRIIGSNRLDLEDFFRRANNRASVIGIEWLDLEDFLPRSARRLPYRIVWNPVMH
jgi:hypothetical protein